MWTLASLRGALGARYFFCLAVAYLGVLALLFAAPASAAGPYLKLIEVTLDPPNGMFPVVQDGSIQQVDAYYKTYQADYSWTPPPATMDENGGSVSLNVSASAVSGAGINTGLGLSGRGFDFEGGVTGTEFIWAHAGESKSTGATVSFKPAAGLSPGSIIELKVGVYYAGGATYRYEVSADPVDGGDDGDDGNDDGQPQEGPLRVQVDCPGDIVVGALPSLNCHLLISGFRRNTADPVEVLVPAMLDQFGNHANGIQVVDLDGAQDVFNWDSTYSWGFFVYACQAPNIGANCYDNVATPGVATIPVTVKQKGLRPVNLILTFNVIARGGQVGGAGPLVRIGSRWIASTFINIESGQPANTTIILDWLSAQWTLDPVDGGYVRIHSVWKPDEYLHIENGYLQSGPIQPEWQSALWQMEPRGDGYFVRFRNVWQPETYLNVESGNLASGPIGEDWLSADWWLLR